MFDTLDAALGYIKTNPRAAISDPEHYRAACELIVTKRSELTHRVFINLPSSRWLFASNDPMWDAIKAATAELCNICGHERVIDPEDMRHEFRPSTASPFVMRVGDKAHIRAIDSPAIAAYARFEVLDTPKGMTWTIDADPLSPSIHLSARFKERTALLFAEIQKTLINKGEPVPLARDVGRIKAVPLVAIQAVDIEVGVITLQLDEAVEVFDPAAEPAHQH